MKNPNGYGSVYKLSGKRRRPFGARITVGWDENKKQIYQNLGYYKTRPEAMIALAEYNKNPYDIDAAKITFSEVFERWSKEKYQPDTNMATIYNYNAAFNHCSDIYDIPFADLRKSHLQGVVDSCPKGWGTKKNIKMLFGQLYKFADEYDIVEKDYSAFVKVGENDKPSTREPFSNEEIKVLWDNAGKIENVDTVLIMIYTGLRPGELVTIETENVHLDEHYMQGGIKTAAGKTV